VIVLPVRVLTKLFSNRSCQFPFPHFCICAREAIGERDVHLHDCEKPSTLFVVEKSVADLMIEGSLKSVWVDDVSWESRVFGWLSLASSGP
jgi:hypothetical protein